jgi:colanic acid biosynthesis protein WcaH
MIPLELYTKIIDLIPIVCVDIIIEYNKKYLLVKRNNKPLKNEWWVVGGRILKNELAEDACRRKMLEETGLSATKFKFVGVYQDVFEESSYGKHDYHTISLVFESKVDDLSNLKLDNQSSHWHLSDTLPDRLKIIK